MKKNIMKRPLFVQILVNQMQHNPDCGEIRYNIIVTVVNQMQYNPDHGESDVI